MNEQIKALWDKAAQLESDPSWEGQTRFMEKFAELIVRECAMLVEGFILDQEVSLDEYVEYEASEVLKEHFGVE